MNNYRVVVTGGSGFIGTNAIDYLIDNGIPCINIDFQPPRNKTQFDYWIKTDLLDYNALKAAILKFNPSHILHLAAAVGMDHTTLDTLTPNTNGVKNLIKIAKEIVPLERILFTSSLLVCRIGFIPENETEYCPPNLYGESKVIGEEIVRSSDLNCEWAIARPTSIWGPWFEYSYRKFFKTIDKNMYMHIGKEEFQKPASYVGNTVYMLMKLLLEDNIKINKNTFYLADYPWYSTKEWANTIQKTLKTKSIKTAPFWLLRLLALSGDIYKKLFKNDPPLTSLRLNNMLTGGKYQVKNTKEVCGKLPFDLEEAVCITAQWMLENNLIKHKPTRISQINKF